MVHSPALSPLSHTSQGFFWSFFPFFYWSHMTLSESTCYVVRGGALGICQVGVIYLAPLWCCLWERVWEGTVLFALLSVGFQSLPPLLTSNLGPSGADSQVGGLVHILGPCGSLQQTLLWGWEFLPLSPRPPQIFTATGFETLFPRTGTLGCAVSFPSCSFWVLHMNVGTSPLLHQLLPCPPWSSSPLPCPRSPLPLLPVWTKVSSLTPWLSDFHIVWFSGSSGRFLFLNLCCPFGCARKQSVSMPPSWPEVGKLHISTPDYYFGILLLLSFIIISF